MQYIENPIVLFVSKYFEILIIEEDTIVESPVDFFFDMEHDDKSFSDDDSKSSIESNNINPTLV